MYNYYEREREKLVKLLILSLEKLIFNRDMVDHYVIILFLWKALSSCLNKFGEEEIDVIDDHCFCSDCVLLVILIAVVLV